MPKRLAEKPMSVHKHTCYFCGKVMIEKCLGGKDDCGAPWHECCQECFTKEFGEEA